MKSKFTQNESKPVEEGGDPTFLRMDYHLNVILLASLYYQQIETFKVHHEGESSFLFTYVTTSIPK